VIHFHRADPAYGAGVARRMGVPAPVEAQAAE
jgi:catalase